MASEEYLTYLGKLHDSGAYEMFKLEWARICARLNPSQTNKERLAEAEKRAKMLEGNR